MDNPYCSCKLTRVRSQVKELTVQLGKEQVSLACAASKCGLYSNIMALVTSECGRTALITLG